MKITADAIIYNNQIYPTKNISSARMIHREYKRRLTALEIEEYEAPYRKRASRGFWILLISIAVGGFGFPFGNNPLIGVAVLAAIPLGLIGLILILISLKRGDNLRRDAVEHGVELVTNAGHATLFFSSDLAFIERIRDLVFEALSSSSRAISYNVNIEKQEIIDNSVSLTTNNTINNYDYSVNYTKYEGIQPKDLEFLTGQFTTALGQLAGEINALKNPDVKKEFEALNQELKKPTPNPGAVKTTWGKLKGLCEVYDIGDKLTSIVTLGITIITTVATKVAASS